MKFKLINSRYFSCRSLFNSCFFILFLFSTFFNTSASANDDIDLLKNYISTKQYQLAFQLSDKLTYEFGGEVEFDLLAGIAAFGAGMYQNAIFSFERVVMLKPLSFYGRYYLALSYRKVDNLHAALSELDKLFASPITEQEKAKVKLQILSVNSELTDRKRSWSHDVSLMFGFDNNVNRGSSEEEIFLPNGAIIPLFDSSQATHDQTYAISYHGNYQYPFTQNQWLNIDFNIEHVNYISHTEYLRESINLAVKYEYQLLNDATWNIGFSTAPLWFSGEKYRRENSFNAGWQQAINRNSSYGINTSLSNIDHIVNNNLDLDRFKFNAFYRYQTSIQQMVMANWYKDENKGGLKHNNKSVYGITYLLSYPIFDQVVGSSLLMYEQQKYQGTNPLFNVYSDSTLISLGSQLMYNLTERQQLQFQILYQDKQVASDLQAMKIFEYDRLEISLTWLYKL